MQPVHNLPVHGTSMKNRFQYIEDYVGNLKHLAFTHSSTVQDT